MSDDGDIIPSVMQNGGNQYKIKEVGHHLIILNTFHKRSKIF